MGDPVSVQAASSLFDRVAVIALGVAVVVGCLRQGGFYAGDAALVIGLVAVAVAARFAAGAERLIGPVTAAAVALLAFAGWTVLSAALHGAVVDGIAPAAMTCGIAGVLWVAAGASTAALPLLRAVLLAAGVLVALTGWAGVALHVEPLALLSSGLWRASSTLTYANATAALLTITVLLAVVTHRPDQRLSGRCTVAVMLLGLLATMSRAGLLALAVGLAVCACSASQRARMAQLWPAVPAAAVAAAGLLPALPGGSPAAPVPALAGAVAGAAVLHLARRRAGVVAGLVGVGVAAAVLSAGGALHGIADTRVTSSSPERGDLSRITFEQFAASPVTGVGPGRLDFVYIDHTGTLVTAEYTHDEYLQTAAETGVTGLILVVSAFGALGVGALRLRSGAGALAIVAAFGVHSAFDFLWHIPVLPLLAAAAVAPLLATPDPTPTENP